MVDTPMMRQYQEAKTACPDALLLFRMGDFYELFFDDARTAAKLLGLALTSRDKGENAVPMAGFPHHQLESYLRKLVSLGLRVAICEQMENPEQAKGLVKREVTRVVTPGTLTDDALLNPNESNYLAAVVVEGGGSGIKTGLGKGDSPILLGGTRKIGTVPGGFETAFIESNGQAIVSSGRVGSQVGPHSEEVTVGLAWVELSTGRFHAAVFQRHELADQLARINPAECLIDEQFEGLLQGSEIGRGNLGALTPALSQRERVSGAAANGTDKMVVTRRPSWAFSLQRRRPDAHEAIWDGDSRGF